MTTLAVRVIDELNRMTTFSREYNTFVGMYDSVDDYKNIFLGNPTKEVVDAIINNNGVMVSDKHDYGILFSVPFHWVVDGERKLKGQMIDNVNDNIDINNGELDIKLVILSDNPIIVYSKKRGETIGYISDTYLLKGDFGFKNKIEKLQYTFKD